MTQHTLELERQNSSFTLHQLALEALCIQLYSRKSTWRLALEVPAEGGGVVATGGGLLATVGGGVAATVGGGVVATAGGGVAAATAGGCDPEALAKDVKQALLESCKNRPTYQT